MANKEKAQSDKVMCRFEASFEGLVFSSKVAAQQPHPPLRSNLSNNARGIQFSIFHSQHAAIICELLLQVNMFLPISLVPMKVCSSRNLLVPRLSLVPLSTEPGPGPSVSYPCAVYGKYRPRTYIFISQSSSDELVPERLYTKVNIKVCCSLRLYGLCEVWCVVGGERSRLCGAGQLLSLCNHCRECTWSQHWRKVGPVRGIHHLLSVPSLLHPPHLAPRVALPTRIQKFTVLKSPHIYKKHRVQYEIRTHSRLMQVCYIIPACLINGYIM